MKIHRMIQTMIRNNHLFKVEKLFLRLTCSRINKKKFKLKKIHTKMILRAFKS